MVSVLLSLSFFPESPTPLASSDRPSATAVPSVVVDSMKMLFGKHVCWSPRTKLLGNIEGLASGSDVAVTVEIETPFLLVVLMVKGE